MSILLETERLIVKVPTAADIDNWTGLLDEETKSLTQKYLDRHIAHHAEYGFCVGSVYLKDSGVFIGRSGISYYFSPEYNEQNIEMDCALHKNYWSKGYGAELSKAFIELCFNKLGIDRVTTLTQADNEASHHIFKKIGMRYAKDVLVVSENKEYMLYEIYSQPFQQLTV